MIGRTCDLTYEIYASNPDNNVVKFDTFNVALRYDELGLLIELRD